ncbi:adenylyltransferase/cytidyltransferase family protein [Candidatus Nanohalobium constans]|uniref:Nicotinamide-nucleotide adenylyltransferase n=1 Tax=Candidatus Nanohalobium constans TaxID=2565781 RepID=A0A5Q0UGD2_9ARCH|nr:adenylyltransferase/cytidyltransferase family protein [Candidatus Nanohalobium constans]QGA80049.1 nicotinamide-nucleotide adenylyltransferase [Candidatus Nanohalobium constans]
MVSAFIGRFQPFHLGHKHVVDNHEGELVLVIGSSEKSRTDDNPLTAEERKEIIRGCFPDIKIFEVSDRESDKEWKEEVLEKTEADKIISGNERVRKIFEDEVEVAEPNMHQPEIYSGTEVRRRVNSGGEWSYLVPECAKDKIKQLEETIKKSGTQYEFEPGWKKENAFHGTADK